MKKNSQSKAWGNKKGSTIVEIIIVIVLMIVLVPSALSVYLSARKVSGQAYVQHQAAVTLGETNDIIKFLRNQGFDLLENGEFFLIRNPGSGSWLVKNDLPDLDTYERKIVVSNALRHDTTGDLYFDGDIGGSVEDTDTKKIEISILWSPDYLPLEQISQTVYISNWQKVITY